MQLESALLSCPLCKQQMARSSREQAANTRLCGSCQAIVLTAFRGGRAVAATAPQALPVIARSDASTFEQSLASSPSFFELSAVDATPFEHEARSPMPFEPVESVKFNFYQEDDSPDIERFEPESENVSSNGSGEHREDLLAAIVQTNPAAAPQQPDADKTELIAQLANEEGEAENAVTDEMPSLAGNESENSDFLPVAGPQYLQESVGSRDSSNGEFPIFIGPSQQKSFSRLRWVIAAVFVVATAAALYFFVYRPSTPQNSAIVVNSTGGSSVDSRAIANGAATSSSAMPAKPVEQPPLPASSANTETSAREAAPANGDTPGGFSLQAAAFPTQGGADEFAARLKQVGLASYVVPANLARRGKWFRVRVGRFSSAEDAQKFAGEAQQRARVAGLAVQLIVCQYDQP